MRKRIRPPVNHAIAVILLVTAVTAVCDTRDPGSAWFGAFGMFGAGMPESASHEAAGLLAGTAMADGRSVGDLLSPETASVVLVYDPSECFSCTGLLPQWIELGREWSVPVRLVLTRQPTPAETNKLKLLRVIPAGVLKAEPSDTPMSIAYIFDGMTELASAIGASKQSALLTELTTPASTEDKSNPHLPKTHRR